MSTWKRAAGALFLGAALVLRAPAADAQAYDLVLRNARIVDGTGSPWYRADLAVRGDTIARIAAAITDPGARVIDLGGLAVAPGFIDLHTHAARGIFQVPTADNYVRQGVTTILEGPDGGSPVPLKPFLDKLEALPKSLNIASFLGQGSVREAVVGLADRPASAQELERMRALVEQGMRDGAFGLSTGLFYVPGIFTPLSEVVELEKVAGRLGGVHTSHMRDEASRVQESVRETIAIDEARSRGVDTTLDQYPYTASSTRLEAALLPAWALEGGAKQTEARLKDPATRAKIRAVTADLILNERGGGDPRNVVLTLCEWDMSFAGRNLAELTRSRGAEPTMQNAAETALLLTERGGCRAVFHSIGEEDLVRILRHPATMIASDGEVPIFGRGAPHPRSYGTFARVLAVYVREKGILTLEEAVRKMSSFPAARIGLADRGVLRPGMKADIAVFDPARVRDAATFEKPHQYAAGFAYVIVNGQVVYENGAMTAARPGRVLYGPAKSQK